MTIDDFITPAVDGFDFNRLHAAFPWVRAMAETPQDPRYHAEGDVWTHTRMVCQALVADDGWGSLPRPERRLLLTAALLHDAGKPEVTFTDAAGRIRSPEHAVRGETLARRLLWDQGCDFAFREDVAALVRLHMQPRYVMEQKDPGRRVFAISHVTRSDLLAMLARADTRGRIAPDHEVALSTIARYVEFCSEHDCLTRPRPFSSDQARFLFFRGRLDDPGSDAAAPTGPAVTVMSGLPGAGKDSWVRSHLGEVDVVSLDQIRLELGISPDGPQQQVVALAHRRLRDLLAAGRDVVWNATTLSRRHRETLLDLVEPWDPWIHMVHVDAPASVLFRQNRQRPDHAVVPEQVIWRMTGIWQPPDATEAHRVTRISQPIPPARRRREDAAD
jgi:predicted kinase